MGRAGSRKPHIAITVPYPLVGRGTPGMKVFIKNKLPPEVIYSSSFFFFHLGNPVVSEQGSYYSTSTQLFYMFQKKTTTLRMFRPINSNF